MSIFVFVMFKKYSDDLPDYEQLKSYTPMITTRLYAKDGSLISEFSKEKRVFVPIQMIPKNLINAFLAAEDANFYDHSGVDPIAIFRTAVLNFFAKLKGDSIVGGASTITQQVVKNFLLTRERTFERKIKEAILAIQMTNSFSKEHVLELYLNQIYLGSGAYGVAAAAQVYFGKSIDELGIEEVALLATLPKAPSKLDPRKNIEKAKIRRDWVIGRMLDEDFITEEEAEMAMERPIIVNDYDSYGSEVQADFFADSVKKELTQLYGSDNVFESGITVYTTLSHDLQKTALDVFQKGIESYDIRHGYRGALGKIDKKGDWIEGLKNFTIEKLYKNSWQKAVVLSSDNNSATIGVEDGSEGKIPLSSLKWAKKHISNDYIGDEVRKASEVLKEGDVILVEKTKNKSEYELRQIPEVNGGLLAMDPHTGRILAMVGGYIDAPNQFNRTTQAKRQPGSTMKTFGYVAALENGMTPATIIIDEPVSLDQGEDLPPYSPKNYSERFYGPTTLRTGLEKSRNVTTVRMADQVGLGKVVDVVKRFGINDDPEHIYSLVLGSTETTLMRLVTAYSMMVNGGNKITPSMIEKMQDRDGSIIYRRDNRECPNCKIDNLEAPEEKDLVRILTAPTLEENQEKLIDDATAYQITSMLQGVVERGTSRRARAIGKVIGGKTGTTNNSYDSWFVGFSPDLVAAVYVGYDTPASLGAHETGSSLALPIFVDFMKEALKDTPSTPFRVPNSIKFVKINRKNGKLATPKTAKSDILFEAFKLEDHIIEDGDKDDGSIDFYDSGDHESVESDLQGIY